jgi:DNA-directed RNA polymerase subunit delta
MKRIITSFEKLDEKQIELFKTQYPDGYSSHDIVSFKNLQGIETKAIQINTNDTIYLVKLNEKLVNKIYNDDDDDDDDDDFDKDLEFDLNNSVDEEFED